MRRTLVVALLALGVLMWSCNPAIPQELPKSYVTARFDPSVSPPVVPSPNDLAVSDETKLVTVTIPDSYSAPDRAFFEYLNTLKGFPAGATASATFDAELKADSVTTQSVIVFDVTDPNPSSFTTVPVTLEYVDTGDVAVPAQLNVRHVDGVWATGHRYAVALVGGQKGIKSKDGRVVINSATFQFLKSEKPLVSCDDTGACIPATELFPSAIKDDQAARFADQTATANRLEGLRIKYKPYIEHVLAGGISRDDLVLLWSFNIDDSTKMQFSPTATPPKMPTPTDLSLKQGTVSLTVDSATSAANQEYVRDYLNTLNGFLPSSQAAVEISDGPLDPDTINADTVFVYVVNGEELDEEPVIEYDATTNKLTVSPGGGSWGKSRTIGIVVLGGADGVKNTRGESLVGTDAWAFVRSKSTIVECENITDENCLSLVKSAPVSRPQAIALESMRRLYEPLLLLSDADEIPREDIAGAWLFSTVNQPELTFDLEYDVTPFPNNAYFRSADDRSQSARIDVYDGVTPTQDALAKTMRTLDGFSTTAPISSEDSWDLAALDEGAIDPLTLSSVGFVKIEGDGPADPDVTVCTNCGGTTTRDTLEKLQWVPNTPLEENTRYGAYVPTVVADTDGRRVMASPWFALVRLKNPVFENGHSTILTVSDEVAEWVEPIRESWVDCIDQFENVGVPRSELALGFCLTTQTISSKNKAIIDQVHAGAGPGATVPWMSDATAQLLPGINNPGNAISKVLVGDLAMPFALTGAQGAAVAPTLWTGANTRPASFVLTIPSGTVPTAGWPVVVFEHTFGRSRMDALSVAGVLAAQGLATIAVDQVFHGDRSTCVGAATAFQLSTDDHACANPITQMCSTATGRCVARVAASATACVAGVGGDAVCAAAGEGRCLLSGRCEGGTFAVDSARNVVVSGNAMMNITAIGVTGDRFAHAALYDLPQLVRVLETSASTAESLNARLQAMSLPQLNGANLAGLGHGIGANSLAVYGAASPKLKRMVWNAAGSTPIHLAYDSDIFESERERLLTAAELEPGVPVFDEYVFYAQTIFDRIDPRNAARASVANGAGREVFVQYVEGDTFITNARTESLIAAASVEASHAPDVQKFAAHTGAAGEGKFPATWAPDARHLMLVSPGNSSATPSTLNAECNDVNPNYAFCATNVAQSDVATFISTGVAP